MTAPPFDLPTVNPLASGAAAQGAAQGPVAGFEALLAAFFGEMGEAAEGGALAGADATAADKPEAADDPAPAGDPTAPPPQTMTLAALLTTQQPALSSDAQPEGGQTAEEAPGASSNAGTGLLTASQPAAAEETTKPVMGETATAPPQADERAPALAPITDGEEQAATAAPSKETPAQKPQAEAASAAATRTAPETQARAEQTPPTTPNPSRPPKAPVEARPPAQVTAPQPSLAAPAEQAEAVAQAGSAAPSQTPPDERRSTAQRTHRQGNGDQRHLQGADARQATGAPDLSSQVKATDATGAMAPEDDIEIEGPSSASSQPAKPDSKAPDLQPLPAQAAPAAQAPIAAHAVRATSETVANLTAEIGRKLEGRATRFDVELTPAGLGHVSVSVEIAASGKMTAAMSFDSPQAAAELRSRSHELQKALEQAGFDVAGGLSFDVNDRGEGSRQLAQQQQQQDGGAWRGRAFQAVLNVAGEAAETAASAALRYNRRPDAGVDIRI